MENRHNFETPNHVVATPLQLFPIDKPKKKKILFNDREINSNRIPLKNNNRLFKTTEISITINKITIK
jgi:hypothetical protein